MMAFGARVALLVAIATPAAASAQSNGEAAFLFGYRPRPGMDAEFAEGYRRHLAWHADQRDSLTWLGWSVLAGAGLGMFVDGVFGIRFQAFDERVDPQGDARDAAVNVTPFAQPEYRHAYRLRRDLSSATRLEDRTPSPMQQVLWLSVTSTGVQEFERVFAATRAVPGGVLDFATYELVAGGEQPAYMLIVQLDSWANLEDAECDPGRLVLRTAGSAVTHARSEIWVYRRDLTYIPQ